MSVALKDQRLQHYRVAIIHPTDDSYIRSFVCDCGHTYQISKSWNHWNFPTRCPKCSISNIKKLQRINKAKKNLLIDSHLELIDKTMRGFTVQKVEVLADIDENNKITTKYGKRYELIYDIVDKRLQAYKFNDNGQKEDLSIEYFFRGIDKYNQYQFINLVSTPENNELFNFALDYLGKINGEREAKIGRALLRVAEHPFLQIMNASGFKQIRTLYGNSNYFNINETQPHKILGLPKYMMPYIRDISMQVYILNRLKELEKKLDGNTVKQLMQIAKEESTVESMLNITDTMIELLENYDYKDIKKLYLYVAREVKLQQGIATAGEAIHLLRDLNRMAKKINMPIDKYTKSLKKDHDIVMMNYRLLEHQIKATEFKQAIEIEAYQNLAYKTKEYTIVLPQEPKDLVDEGSSLGHCVASYVNDVNKLKCKIVFLRRTEAKDESLVTIEVREGNIRQVRGRHNRQATTEEMDFVRKWADKRELTLSVH